MLTREKAIELLGRLRRCGNFPEGKSAGEILREAAQDLIGASEGNSELAEQIIEQIRRTEKFFPSTAVFYEALEAIRQANAPPPYRIPDWTGEVKACPKGLCDGDGWQHVQCGEYSSVKPCTCPAGQAHARKPEPASEPKPARGLERIDARMRASGDE
jgi:hypothetical protein